MGKPIGLTNRARSALNFLASMPSGHTTLDRRDTQSLLLETDGTMLARGVLYNITAKNLGAGVYKITLPPANPL